MIKTNLRSSKLVLEKDIKNLSLYQNNFLPVDKSYCLAFDFEGLSIKGEQNLIVDYLSRELLTPIFSTVSKDLFQKTSVDRGCGRGRGNSTYHTLSLPSSLRVRNGVKPSYGD